MMADENRGRLCRDNLRSWDWSTANFYERQDQSGSMIYQSQKGSFWLMFVTTLKNQKETIRFNDGRNPSESTMVWIVHCFRQHSFVGNVGCVIFYCRSHCQHYLVLELREKWSRSWFIIEPQWAIPSVLAAFCETIEPPDNRPVHHSFKIMLADFAAELFSLCVHSLLTCSQLFWGVVDKATATNVSLWDASNSVKVRLGLCHCILMLNKKSQIVLVNLFCILMLDP